MLPMPNAPDDSGFPAKGLESPMFRRSHLITKAIAYSLLSFDLPLRSLFTGTAVASAWQSIKPQTLHLPTNQPLIFITRIAACNH